VLLEFFCRMNSTDVELYLVQTQLSRVKQCNEQRQPSSDRTGCFATTITLTYTAAAASERQLTVHRRQVFVRPAFITICYMTVSKAPDQIVAVQGLSVGSRLAPLQHLSYLCDAVDHQPAVCQALNKDGY